VLFYHVALYQIELLIYKFKKMKNQEAIEIIQAELNTSIHFSKYPQDRYKDDPQEIGVLITTSEYHKKRAEILNSSIHLLETKNQTFTNTEIEHLQSEVHKITGDGKVMELFNKLLGIKAG